MFSTSDIFHIKPCTLQNGSIFQPVTQHDKDIKTARRHENVHVRLPKRHRHDSGFRRKGAIVIKNSNYELKFRAFNMGDPYQPHVKSPHNAREVGEKVVCTQNGG